MTGNSSAVADHDERLGDILAAWIEAVESGQAPDSEEWRARHPEFAAELTEFFAAQKNLGVVAEPLRAVARAAVTSSLVGEGLPRVFGDFEVEEEIGRGGMGVVYKARQKSLNRIVALKVLPFAATMDPRHLRRFLNEAQAAASLHHTNIVPVYFVGSERGVHYYAMQFIEGQNLASVIAQQRAPVGNKAVNPVAAPTVDSPDGEAIAPAGSSGVETRPLAGLSTARSIKPLEYFRTVARLGIQAAEALDHAHQMGIMHRDVKPANLLVDDAGRLWVTDFGLAQMQSDTRLTMTGDLVGTLRYMSPEQALAKRVVVDHRTDIYSLGATLYELLTLQPAFDGKDRQELLRQIAFEEPRPLRRWNRAIPQELETIVLKAMERNPADRYATAQELADDLRHFLEDRPIRARRPSLAQRVVKWSRRHRSVFVAAGCVLLFAFLALAVSTVLIAGAYRDEEEQRIKAQDARADEARLRGTAEQERDTAEFQLYVAQMQLALQAWEKGSIKLVQQRLAVWLPQAGKRDLRGWEWDYLQGLCNRATLTVPCRFSDENNVLALAFSPDGKWIACAIDKVGQQQSGVIVVQEADTGRELFRRPQPPSTVEKDGYNPQRLEWSPGGQQLTCFTVSGVRVWDVASGEELFSRVPHLNGRDTMTWAAWSPDGKYLAVAWSHKNDRGTVDSDVELWEPTTQKATRTFDLPGQDVRSWAWAPDSQRLAAVVAIKTINKPVPQQRILFWNLPSGQQGIVIDTDFSNNEPNPHCLAWSPDGRFIALRGRTFFASGNTRQIRLWNPETGEEVLRFGGFPDMDVSGLTRLTWSPDSRFLFARNGSGTAIVFEPLARKEVLRVEMGDTPSVGWLAVSSDGQRLAASGRYGSVNIWELASGRETVWIRGHTRDVSAVAWTPDGKRLASGDIRGTVKIWDLLLGRYEDALTLRVSALEGDTHMVWGPDSRRLATVFYSSSQVGKGEDRVGIWDVETGQKIHSLGGSKLYSYSIAWSPDGQHLAVSGWIRVPQNGFVKVWNTSTWEEIRTISGGERFGSQLAFSPDGKRLTTQTPSADSTEVALWDVISGQKLPPTGPRLRLKPGALLSPNGRLAAFRTPTNDGLVVRDLSTEQDILTLKADHLSSWSWSPDGTKLAAGYFEAGGVPLIKVWEVASGMELLTCRGHFTTIWSLAWSPDGKRLASGGFDETVRIWDTTFGMELLTLRGPSKMVRSVEWSPDGKRLAAVGTNGAVKVWDAAPVIGPCWPLRTCPAS